MNRNQKIGLVFMLLGLGSVGVAFAANRKSKKRRESAIAFYEAVEKYVNPHYGAQMSPAFDASFGDNPSQPKNIGTDGECPAGLEVKRISNQLADQLASQIYNAFGFFTDDETKVHGAFQLLESQAQIAQVASTFQKKYKIALLTYLKDQLWETSIFGIFGSGEYSEVMNIVNLKPLITCSTPPAAFWGDDESSFSQGNCPV